MSVGVDERGEEQRVWRDHYLKGTPNKMVFSDIAQMNVFLFVIQVKYNTNDHDTHLRIFRRLIYS